MAEIILQQQWHKKRIDKQKKSHTRTRENHPASHKKCKSHRNKFTGYWKSSWDVKVTLCYWTGCIITSLTLQLTPRISNCSLRTGHQELSQSSSLWSALEESMAWAETPPYLKSASGTLKHSWIYFTTEEGTVSIQAWGLQFSTMVASSSWAKEGTLPALVNDTWRPTQSCRGSWGAAMACPCQWPSLPQELWSTSKTKTAEQLFKGNFFPIDFGLAQGQKCCQKALTEEDFNSQAFTPVLVLC